MRVVVAITAASGAIYARQIVEALSASTQVETIALIFSTNAKSVMEYEGVSLVLSDKITIYDNKDMFAPVASGSAGYDAMVVVPCSMGTMGRIASGVSDELITRAADVMLKERRRLILVVRETPYNLIHIRNMETLTLAGGIIMAASPSFYALPKSVEDLCKSVTERVMAHLGVEQDHYCWGSEK